MNNENETNTSVNQPITEVPVQPVQEPPKEVPPIVETPQQEQVVETPQPEPIVETPIQQVEPTSVENAPKYEIPMDQIEENSKQEASDTPNSEPENKKKSKVGIIIIIIVILMVLGLAGYVVYDHFNKPEEPKPQKEEKITVTKEEAEEYLEYVPFAPEYDLDETGLKNDADYGTNAYSGENISTNQMNEELLLAMAFKEVMVKEATPEKVKAEFCGTQETCLGDSYATIENMNKQVKKMYDLNNIVSKEFSYPGGGVEKTDKYWALFMGKGNLYSLEKINKIVDYKVVDNNKLIITEKAGFFITNVKTFDVNNSDVANLYKYSNTSTKIADNIKIWENNNYKKLSDAATKAFNDNIDKLATFIHTFKLDENNNFYYYSTKVQ